MKDKPSTKKLFAKEINKLNEKVKELEEVVVETVTDIVTAPMPEKGDKGSQGEKGEKGEAGEKGDKGDRGPRGEIGEKGDRGEPGAPGRDGKDGQDGRDGIDGKDGKDGVDGKTIVKEVISYREGGGGGGGAAQKVKADIDRELLNYTLVDGSRPFTGTVGGIDPVDGADLATKDYVDAQVGSFDTFQEIYDNSTTQPQITTDATNGSLQIQRGSAADTDPIFEGLNGSGSTTFSVDGDGMVTSTRSGGGTGAGFLVTSAEPAFALQETGVTADNGRWDFRAQAENLRFRVLSDDELTVASWCLVQRTGTTVDSIAFNATTVNVNGALTADTLDTGQGANELYAMDQDVQTTDDVTFESVTVTQSGASTNSALLVTAATASLGFQETDASADNGIWD